jgi:hypothetical protein
MDSVVHVEVFDLHVLRPAIPTLPPVTVTWGLGDLLTAYPMGRHLPEERLERRRDLWCISAAIPSAS